MDVREEVDEFVVAMEQAMDEPIKCQANHTNVPCSVKVVASFYLGCSHKRWYFCANHTSFKLAQMAKNNCHGCHRPCEECWTVTPC